MSGIFYPAHTHTHAPWHTHRGQTERGMEGEWVRQTDWYIAVAFKNTVIKQVTLSQPPGSASHSCLLSAFSYSAQDILIQPPRRLIVRFLAIFQGRAIKPVGTGIRMIHCIQMGSFVFSELLSLVMLSNIFPFHTSSINQQLIKIIAVLIFKANHCVYCPDQ